MNKQVKAQDVKAAADVVVKDADAAAKAAKEALAAQQLLELAETIKRVKAAQEKYASYGQEQVDEIFRAAALAAETGISTLLAGVLLNRGIDNREKVEEFLHPEKWDYHDPYLLPDMAAAVKQIGRASCRERV